MANANDDGLVGTVKEIADLVKTYAQQETVDPIKRAGRYLALGVAGSVLIGFGVIFLMLAALRALQTETTAFDGNWSVMPYVIVLVGTALVAGLAAMAITRGKRA